MPESQTTQTPEVMSFDPSKFDWITPFEELPLRALVTLVQRCAKRFELWHRLRNLIVEAYSGGVDVKYPVLWELIYPDKISDFVAGLRIVEKITFCTEYTDEVSNVIYGIANHIGSVARTGRGDAADLYAASVDLKNLLGLKLGKPGEPGEPIRWNDPRLGPLWPAGTPEWYVRVEHACQELEEKLGQLSGPKTPPDDTELHPQIEEWRKLEAMYNQGKLDEYRGEFVIWANGEIFAHGRKLLSVRLQAEKMAEARGISRTQLIDYFVAGE